MAVTADVHFSGLLFHLDISVGRRLHHWDLRHHLIAEVPLRALILFGQRGVVAPLAVAFFGWLSWRQRSTEPLLRLLVALLAIAALVYALKYTVSRPAPIDYFAHRGVSGRSYPSGHLANGIALWGLVLFAAVRWRLASRAVTIATVLRWIAPLAVVTGMTLLNYHWLSDFVGGAAAGLLALAVAVLGAWTAPAARLDARIGWCR